MYFVNKIVEKTQDLFNKIMMLVPSASGSILYNKWILYFIAAISIIDLVNFYTRGNLNAVILFFAVGILTTFFSKNMTVVLVIAIAISHIVTYGTKSLEGLEDNSLADEEEDAADEEEDAADEEEDAADEEEDAADEEEDAADEEAMTDNKKPIKDSFESIAKTAKTVSLLSKDTKDLPAQTAELLNKQKELMANMTQLQPLLKKAEELIKTESFATMNRGPVYAEYK